MALSDVMGLVAADKKPKEEPKKKTISFDMEVWKQMETKYGKTIEPNQVAELVKGIFFGDFDVRAAKKG